MNRSGRSFRDTCHAMNWATVPEEMLSEVLERLSARDVCACARVCTRWREVCARSRLWRRLLARDYAVSARAAVAFSHAATRRPHAARQEYVRCASKWSSRIGPDAHRAPLTNVALSRNAEFCCTTSQDGTFAIWIVQNNQFYDCVQNDVQSLGWWHPIQARFNQYDADTLLLCGALRADASASRGELAVFKISEGAARLRSRVALSPVAARGAWWPEPAGRVLSAQLHRVGASASATALWLSAAEQETDSEFTPVVNQLCRIFNDVGSVPRLLEVIKSPVGVECGADRDLVEVWQSNKDDEWGELHYYEHSVTQHGFTDSTEESNRLIIYTCGTETSTSHTLCFKYISPEAAEWPLVLKPQSTLEERIRRRSEQRQRREETLRMQETHRDVQHEDREDIEAVRALCVTPDRIIDLQGHVVGLALAPDHMMVYAAVHVWVGSAALMQARARVCAVCLRQLRVSWRSAPTPAASPAPLTAASLLHYIQPAVSTYYVASPLGGCSVEVCLWSRASGALLRVLRHAAPAHSVALHDAALCGAARTHLLLCATDQDKLTIWESTPGADNDIP